MMIGYAVSSDSETVETIADNTDFAVESAEIISDDEASMLRIIGKFRFLPETYLVLQEPFRNEQNGYSEFIQNGLINNKGLYGNPYKPFVLFD